jgi:GST-like protein
MRARFAVPARSPPSVDRRRNAMLPRAKRYDFTGHPIYRVTEKGNWTMSSNAEYVPPKVWKWEKPTGEGGWRYATVNRPVAGPTHEKELPVGKHPLQLYSRATPNGVKVTVMLEELLAAGHSGAEYDAWLIDIGAGEQFGSGFVAVNPNSKIPALMDRSGPKPRRVFESGSILLYLAEKFGAFLPNDPDKRTETLNWLFWQMGSTPYLGGGFGHFYHYAPVKIEYAINRFAMEVKRQLDVLDRHLANNEYMAGDDYTIADMAIWPWYGGVVQAGQYGATEFLQVKDYVHLNRWTSAIAKRPAVKRGRMVNRAAGDPAEQLHERHDASDFETKTQDKLAK